MTWEELEKKLPTLKNEQLLNVLDYIARESGIGSFKYCIVRGEIYRRLEEKKDE